MVSPFICRPFLGDGFKLFPVICHSFDDIKPDDIIVKKVFSGAVRVWCPREIHATYCIYLYYIYKRYNVITVVSSRSRAFVHDVR